MGTCTCTARQRQHGSICAHVHCMRTLLGDLEEDPALLLTDCMAVVAAMCVFRSDTPEVRTCKVVLLQGLAAEQTPAQLTAAWVPPSRLWSAMCPSLQVP